MSDSLSDLQYAARTLRRRPGLALAVVLLLAVGIGTSSVVVTLARGTFGAYPPHVAEPDRLVRVTRTTSEVFAGAVGYPDFAFLRDENHTLAGLAAYDRTPIALMARVGATMRQVDAGLVSGGYFAVLGTRPALGRLLRPEDDRGIGGPRVAVIGHHLWTALFDRRPDVAGAAILLGSEPFEVVGVAPSGFRGATFSEAAPDLWVPLTLQPLLAMETGNRFERVPGEVENWLDVIGRLRPGTTVEAAAADLDALAEQMAREYGEWNEGVGMRVSPDVRFQPNLRREITRTMTLLSAVSATILVIACVNVALLLLARGSARSRETAIRRSLGAGRGRIVRQLLAETLLLAIAGAGAGILLAVWSSGAIGAMLLGSVGAPFRPDLAAVGVTGLVTLAAVLLCGLAPALVASRPGIAQLLRSGTGGTARSGRLRVGLVITQVALSLVLVASAGLLVRSTLAAQAVDVGFATDHRLLLPINLERQGYSEARAHAFLREALDRLRGVPGVRHATMTRMVPFRGMWSTGFEAEGVTPPDGSQAFESGANAVGPGYFAAMDIPVVEGREFTTADDEASTPVAVVNQTLARLVWGERSPVGRVIGGGARRATVVGVVRDAVYYDLGEPPQPQLYLSPFQLPRLGLNLLVHTAGPAEDAAAAVAATLRGIDPALVIGTVATIGDAVDRQIRPYRTLAVTVSGVGAMALVLSALGLYGVLAYLVTQRFREFGIRLALGARAREVTGRVVLQGVRLAGIGIVLGTAAAWLAARLVSAFLFRVDAHDPLVLVLAPLTLTAAALLASYLPARRAGAVQPIEALRHE